jgi:acetyltransferase
MSAPDQALPQLQLALRSETGVRARSATTAETLVLADGTRLQLGPIGADHRDGLAALFGRLSPQSRRLRYLGAKRELTPQELARLTDVDHVCDEAIVAIDERDGSIVGVARYAHIADRAGVAEVAAEVADDMQCLGIGTELARRTVDRARANGLTLLTATTLWENKPARALLRGLGFRPRESHGREIELELELSPHGDAGRTCLRRRPGRPPCPRLTHAPTAAIEFHQNNQGGQQCRLSTSS